MLIWLSANSPVGGRNFPTPGDLNQLAKSAEQIILNSVAHQIRAGNLSYEMPTAADVWAEPELGNPDADAKALVSTAAGVRSWAAREPALGNPAADGDVLSSTSAGVRSWITPGGSGSGVWQRLTPSVNFTLPWYSANAYKLAAPLTVGDGHCICIRASICRDSAAHGFCVAVSSDNFATYIAFSFNPDGQRVNYAYYAGSLHVVSNNAITGAYIGAHLLDIRILVNSVANGGFGSYWTAKLSTDPGPSTEIPVLASYTNVALDGANFQIAVVPPNVMADLKALDVEIL